jgi:LysR family transcriptional regulator, benzoate and cis,cis-muconate-responsive activator of ben and cat genes
MELRDLRGFVMLGEVLHFGRAALRLHLTQSALSKQIHRLETALGGALFERGPSGIRLTALGRSLYPDACAIVGQSDLLTARARDVTAGVAGTLRLGFGVASKDFVPALIARFRERRPEVKIELSDLSTHHQIEALGEGRLDLGFCRLPAPQGWPALPVVQARFVAVLPRAYPTGIELADLAAKPLILIRHAQAPSFHDYLMNYFARTRLRFAETLPANDFPAAVALAAAGVGWAIVPSSTAIDPLYVRAVPLTDPAAGWQIGLVRAPGAADILIEAFWAEAKALAAHIART